MITIVAMGLAFGIGGAAVAQTGAGGSTSPSIAMPPATAPPQPITGPSARAPSISTVPPAASAGNAASAAAGRSFTEAEALSRIEAQGYSNVAGLRKDAQSIWHGTAMRNGQPVRVALDYRGNVVAQ
jgi:periplasmic protein CpxP/Spy